MIDNGPIKLPAAPMITPINALHIAQPNDTIRQTILNALRSLKLLGVPYAYFQHNGVIVTVDRNSTLKSALEDWGRMLKVLCDTCVAELAND
jgi:hypothetical protein